MMVNPRLQMSDAPVRSLRWRIIQIIGLAWLALVAIVRPAVAHHAMGNRVPANFFEGFLSGLAHPVIGLDHLVFVVAIGLLSVKQVRGALLPLFFVVAAMVGTGLHLAKLNLPLTEGAIAISVIALGVLLVLGRQFNFFALSGVAAAAGLFHGYAYGESIVGAEMTPLIAYLLGFTAIQYAIAFAVFWLGSKAMQGSTQTLSSFMRYFGYAVCVMGAVFLSTALHG